MGDLARQPAAFGKRSLGEIRQEGGGRANGVKAGGNRCSLCHGWIDGQLKPFDDKHWLIRFTPRHAKSKWSAINCRRVEALIAAGLMRPAGLAEVERAKADGRWEMAYQSQSTITMPSDLQHALDANQSAKTLFEVLDSANRYAVLYRVHTAKKPETRARAIEKLVAMLARGETIHPRRGKS